MPGGPASAEVGAALARYFHAGVGPSHTELTRAITVSGYAADAPYDAETRTPNKATRVRQAFAAAQRRPHGARTLVDQMLMMLRVGGYFEGAAATDFADAEQALRQALGPIPFS